MTDKDVGALWRSANGIGQQCRPRPPGYVADLIRKLVEEAAGCRCTERICRWRLSVLERFDIDPRTF